MKQKENQLNPCNLGDKTLLGTQLKEMVQGFQIMQSIFVVTKLGIPDLIQEGCTSCNELAKKSNTNGEALYRLLRALASVGIFLENETMCFHLTPLGTCLLDRPDSMRNYVLFQGEVGYACWGELIHSLQTGQNSFEFLYGMKRIQYFQQNPKIGQIWDGLNTSLSAIQTSAIINAYDFSIAKKIADIGGGQGSLLASILKRYPTLQGILFEQPYPVEKAKDLLNREGVRDRCELVVGNFCKFISIEADLYLMKNVIQTLEKPIAINLLQDLHKSMKKGAKLLIVERVMGISKTDWTNYFANLNSLVLSSGKFRMEHELKELLKVAKFKIVRIIPTESVVSIVECIPN
ncbi:MAG: methyltransferase [Cyanobacteria bacterium SBLK]|nr:methyltransferase [Cyanobacteria bacterium SBLK]